MVIQIDMEPGEETKAFEAVKAVLSQLASCDSRIAKTLEHMSVDDYVAGMPDVCKAIISDIDQYLEGL